MEIQILSLGKFRSSIPFKDIFNFYKNRISFDLNLVELKTFDTEKSRKLKLEKNEITKHLKKEDCVVILDKAGKSIIGRPDAVLFRKDEEKILHEKINEIRKAFTVKDDNKDYESLLIKLSDTKESTDNFFDNVVVNDENQDIKNNRLELLKMFCNTFDNFIDFSKLEGL